MTVVQVNPARPDAMLEVVWERLPEDFQLEDEPVDNTRNLLLRAVEKMQRVEVMAEQERQRAEQEKQEKERLLAYLRSLGVDPEQIQ